MKMGRLIVVLFLVVVGAGCGRGKGEKGTEKGNLTANPATVECEVNEVFKWPSSDKKNPTIVIPEGATAFVGAKDKHGIRARLHSAKTRSYVLPLNELRNGDESLYYGVAPQDCWASDPYKTMCVKCKTNVNAEISELCCFPN